MAYKVRVTATAEAEADETYEWLARRAPLAAARWYRGLLDAIASLADAPQRCSLAAESAFYGKEIRQLLYGKRLKTFRIIFIIRADTVHVLHIQRATRRYLRREELSEGDD